MKRRLLFTLLGAWVCFLHLMAADLPKTSSEEDVTWYYIQFTKGGNYVTDQGEAAICQTAALKAAKGQQWKIEGDAGSGYTFTNKLGRKLYVDAAQQTSGSTGFFYAGTNPTANDKFALVKTADGNGWLIAPFANKNVFMNQYQGAGSGKKLAMWGGTSDAGSALAFVEAGDLSSDLHLIPYPKSLTKGEGTLDVTTLTTFVYPDEDSQLMAEDFVGQLKTASGIALTLKQGGTADEPHAIRLLMDNSLSEEAYSFVSDADGVTIKSAGHAGFFYALQTLKQLLPTAYFASTQQSGVAWTIPVVTINDQPELGYRGFHLDVARHFFTKEEVKRVLDIMSFYKLNRFHWHLTDDQGWRVEIPEYPLLTTVGAVRSGSIVNINGFQDDTEYGEGMFYTLAELKEIVDYAKERNIEIIPEIDLPGHMVAAVTAYPVLGCHPDTPTEVRVSSGISKDVLNIGKDTTITFLKCVLGHVADVFPYKYIHLGGDECPTDQWKTNADCLQRVKDENLTGVEQLQSWLVEELGVWLKNEKNKDIIGWDEIMANWQDDNTLTPTIMQWNIGEAKEQVAKTIEKGFSSIMVPYQTLYLDFYQVAEAERFIDEPYDGGWGNGWINSLDEIYAYNPLSKFTDANKNLCLGVQGNMWTETCNNAAGLEFQMLPRLLALAEIGWLPNDQKNWTDFLLRMQPHGAIFDALGYVYAKHFFTDEKTEAEAALAEAERILDAATPGAAGYADAATYEALRSAYDALAAAPADADKATALTAAIATVKAAPIVQPTEGKPYQIVSASTYYKANYAGSTMYEKDGTVRIHYTPQVEPEELWTFVKSGDGYVLKSYSTGHTIALPSYNANATSTASASTPLRVDKATVAGTLKGAYDFIPGAVTLSGVSGYSAAATGSVNRLYAQSSGYVKSYDDPTICYQGTWMLVEISDFKAQLQGLVTKAEKIVKAGTTGGYNEPTEEAIAFLNEKVVTDGKASVADGVVSEETYKKYVALYEEYLAMPRKQVYDALDEGHVYTISLVYSNWSNYYAKADAANNQVVPATLVSGDNSFHWYIKKLGDGVAKIYNEATGQATYVGSFAADQVVKLGTEAQATSWQLGWNDTEEASGITIGDGTYSWYSNPNAFTDVRLKPKAWGAAMWKFTQAGTYDGLTSVSADDASAPVRYFDLTGREVAKPAGGIYITDKGRKVILK